MVPPMAGCGASLTISTDSVSSHGATATASPPLAGFGAGLDVGGGAGGGGRVANGVGAGGGPPMAGTRGRYNCKTPDQA